MAISIQSINFKEKLLNLFAKLIHILEEFAIYIVAVLVLMFGVTLFLSEPERIDIENAEAITRVDSNADPSITRSNATEETSLSPDLDDSAPMFYVAVRKLNVRLLPGKNGKIVDVLARGHSVSLMEKQGSWVRISKYYDGETEGVTGTVARWVYGKMLSDKRTENSTPVNYLSTSDDYLLHEEEFHRASKTLIHNGVCSKVDFEQSGGWVRSSKLKPKPIYFAHCHQVIRFDKIYLDTETGEMFRN